MEMPKSVEVESKRFLVKWEQFSNDGLNSPSYSRSAEVMAVNAEAAIDKLKKAGTIDEASAGFECTAEEIVESE